MKATSLFLRLCALLTGISALAEAPSCQLLTPEFRAQAMSAPAIGNRSVLWYRLAFADDSRAPASAEQAQNAMESANGRFQRSSYGKLSLTWTITPLLQLPRNANFYASNLNALIEDSRAAAAAVGFNSADFDRDLLAPPPIPGWREGLAGIGSRWLYISSPQPTMIVHELGHTFGLPHANGFVNRRPDPFVKTSPPFPDNINLLQQQYTFETNSFVGHVGITHGGESQEYGDGFDTMGTLAPSADFSVSFKQRLGWIAPSQIVTVKSNGAYRIYTKVADALDPGRAYAIHIDKPVVGRVPDLVARDYWIEISATQSAVLLRWMDLSQTGPSLLLSTSEADSAALENPWPLAIGRTFDDPGLALSITPLATGGAGADRWIDVQIDFNAGNKEQPPPPSSGAYRITGRVVNTAGQPIPRCYVHNGRISVYAGDQLDFVSTLTDANGSFTLNVYDRLPFTVGASIYGYRFAPGTGERTVAIPDPGVTNVDFTLEPLPRVSVSAPAQLAEGASAEFTISRTGSTAEPMYVLWKMTGAADLSDYSGPGEVGTTMIPGGARSARLPISAVADSSAEPDEPLTLHCITPSLMDRNGALLSYPGWELRSEGAQQKWFQTDPEYATFADASATITIIDSSNANEAKLSLAQNPGGGRTLTLSGPPGATFAIETSTDLRNWQAFTTNRIDSGSVTIALPQDSAAGSRFYRSRLVQ